MVHSVSPHTPPVDAADLSPLAWVLDETRKSLTSVSKALKRFAQEAESARGVDLASVDASQLRMARQQLHQVGGALDMVGQTVAARMVHGMETVVQRFVSQPEECTVPLAASLEQAGFALVEFVENQLDEAPRSALGLFPQYQQVLKLAGADRIHPADLWQHRWHWAQPVLPASSQVLVGSDAVRKRLDHSVLKLMRHADVHAAAELAIISHGLAAGMKNARHQAFWGLATGFFQAVAQGLVAVDRYAKSAVSRVLLQYTRLARGDDFLSDRLAQDLLFFCAQAGPEVPVSAPALAAVRLAWGLDGCEPVDYNRPVFGRYDPSVLAQARRRIEAAKESWSALAGGELTRLRPCIDQFALLNESLLKLHADSSSLVEVLTQVMAGLQQDARVPAPELAIEVATAVLFLDASLTQFDPEDASFAARAHELSERLQQVLQGQQAPELADWMEELYRRVSDRQTMGTVVSELRQTLAEAEQKLDHYFRRPDETATLEPVPALMGQMRGVLSVLGLEQAAQAMGRMRQQVEAMASADPASASDSPAPSFEKLGNSLGAMGFLLDTLSYQPALAKRLFHYDEEAQEFQYIGGRSGRQTGQSGRDQAPEQAVPEPATAQDGAVDVPLSLEQLEHMADQAALDERPALAKTARQAARAARDGDQQALEQAMEQLQSMGTAMQEPEPTAIDEPAKAAPESEAEIDEELLEIFLEEASEVVASGRTAVQALATDPSDVESLTTLRRAFHTLKGSSRMVGLHEFGEAAWALEQLLNVWLAESKPADDALRDVADQALTGFGRWTGDLAAQQATPWRAEPFQSLADALRLRGEHLSLDVLPAAAPDVLAPEAIAASASVEHSAEPLHVPGVVSAPVLASMVELPDLDLPDLDLPDPDPALSDRLEAQGADTGAGAVEDSDLAVDDELGPDDVQAWAQAMEHADPTEAEPPVAAVEQADGSEGGQDSGAPEDVPPLASDLDLGLDLVFTDSAPFADSLLGTPTSPSLLRADTEGFDEELEDALETGVSEGAVADQGTDPDIVEVGELRINEPLFKVYVSEAGQWSEQLRDVVQAWSRELQQPVPERAIARAHSLAGSSGTVGFSALSELARAVEHALLRLQSQDQGTAGQAEVLCRAADEIRTVLEQFAASQLQLPDRTVLEQVLALEPQLPTEPEAVADADSAPEEDASPFQPADDAPAGTGAVAVLATVEPWPVPASGAAPDVPQPAVNVVQDIDERIDAVDAIDPDLFPIFEEEADELLPQLTAAVRRWLEQPAELSARGEALRVLHTLKGSARLAGAMRLGEMAHQAESMIETLSQESLDRSDIEPVLDELDRMEQDFQRLRDEVSGQSWTPRLPEQAAVADEDRTVEPEEASATEAEAQEVTGAVDGPVGLSLVAARASARQSVRVQSQLLDRLLAQAGELMTSRARMDADMLQLRTGLHELDGNVARLRHQLRDIELQAETQMQSRLAQSKDDQLNFDPLEFDRFTRMQELSRMMAESVNDVATVQRNLQRVMESSEDALAAQARQSRELQRDLLRTRMVEFDGIAERLYRVVRQAAKESDKQVRLDILGGSIEVDRGILDRMTPAFEHLLRNSVVHGIEEPELRSAAGKQASGQITVEVQQSGNDVAVEFRDDGAGLNIERIRRRAIEIGLLSEQHSLSEDEVGQLIFAPGFTTASDLTGLAGRGVGMDVVRTEVQALGGRIETQSQAGRGSRFRLVLPLTTAVTHVVMLRAGDRVIGVPAHLIEVVLRADQASLERAYREHSFTHDGQDLPFFWAGSLLQHSLHSSEPPARTLPVVVVRSADQRVALHVDEVLGNQEVVIKALGPQLSRMPGLVAITALASGAVTLIYNPVALATVYGAQVRAAYDQAASEAAPGTPVQAQEAAPGSDIPLVLVVDDSITVRRVTQRLLQREGYRVALAADGLQGLERLREERPVVVLSDIEMPRMDGFDFLRNIRAQDAFVDLPVVMITSRIAEKHREHARQLGADHYLGKPYSEDELLALVQSYAQVARTVDSAQA